MALIDLNLYSPTLRTQTDIRVILPTPMNTGEEHDSSYPLFKEGGRYLVLYLLHGATGDRTVWTRHTGIERYAHRDRLAVVMPSAGNSFYLDMAYGPRYLHYIGTELPAVVTRMFPLSTKRDETAIAGMSMGGYGAFRIALEHPERYGAAATLSGAIWSPLDRRREHSPIDLDPIFGHGSTILEHNDILRLFAKHRALGTSLPRLYQACGTEDPLYRENLELRDWFRANAISATYVEHAGGHTWSYWDAEIQRMRGWLHQRTKT